MLTDASNGCGFGDGCDYGYGFGDGYSYGYSDESWRGYGNAFGRGYGYGYSDGAGRGHGDCYGDGDAIGYGSGDDCYFDGDYCDSFLRIGSVDGRDVWFEPAFGVAGVGCQVHTLEMWRRDWRHLAAGEQMVIAESYVDALFAKAEAMIKERRHV